MTITADEILAELAANAPTLLDPEYEMTIQMAAERNGWSYDRAAAILNGQVRAGKLTRRKVLLHGTLAYAYRSAQ